VAYLRRGWAPIPLCWPDEAGNCACGRRDENGKPNPHQGKDIGKAPLLGSGYQHVRPTEADVRRWWTRWPRANIGILLEPSGLLVVDCDGQDALNEALKKGLMPGTVAETGSGWHYYYNANGVTGRTTKQGASHGIDVLSLG